MSSKIDEARDYVSATMRNSGQAIDAKSFSSLKDVSLIKRTKDRRGKTKQQFKMACNLEDKVAIRGKECYV